MRALYIFAGVIVAAGAAGMWWAIGGLQDGLAEAPQHWWSSFPLALVALGMALALTAWAVPRYAKHSR